MKKIFLLLPALVLSMMMSATRTEISTSTYGSDNVRKALYYASPNDTIVLADGTYEESTSNYLAFDKNIVLMAAGNGAIIRTQVPVTITNGARAEIIGVKFDATNMTGYSHLIYAADASENNRLIMDGCDIYNYTGGKAIIAARSSNKLDSVIINNCKFYNHTTRSCVFLENTENKGLIVTNSTFYNIATGTVDFSAGIIDDRSTTAKVRVDHCTFYNVQVKNTDYATVGQIKSSNSIVSNCIFAMQESTANLRAIRDVPTANNCLTYNYTKDDNWGIHYSVSKNNCIQLKDPAFVNAASGDFHITDASPAHLVGSDNKSLGAKCWWPAAPETDFATAYNLVGSKAGLVGNIRLNANNNIEYYDNSDAGTAVWEVKATRACAIQAVIDMETGSASGSIFQIKVYKENGEEVGTFDASYKKDDEDINMSGTVYLPKAGVYTFKLFNIQPWSSAKVEKIILSYMGGAVQNISATANTTLPIADAWYDGCTRTSEYIKYPSGGTADAFIKWNIATAENAFYNLTLNVNAPNAHGLTVNVYEEGNVAPIASATEGSYVSATGELAIALEPAINLLGGKNYVVEVKNAPSGSETEIHNLVFAPVVSSVVALPGTLAFNKAVLSGKAHITNDMLYFEEIGDHNPVGQWAQWEVTVAEEGTYLFTLSATSPNGQSYKITILDGENNPLDSHDSGSLSSGDKSAKYYFDLAAGDYYVKVENTTPWSQGHLVGLVATKPSLLMLNEAAEDNAIIVANYRIDAQDIRIKRTIVADMYNTICLPFDVENKELKLVFGEDVELMQMEGATFENGVLNLNFDPATSIYRGTPYLIKTSADVVNPIFMDAVIKEKVGQSSVGDNAEFRGTFIKGEVPAGENNLFLGQNDLLYFSADATPIKGMRAYFHVNVPASAVQRARIVAQGQVVTAIDLVGADNNTIKTIENGQLVIIRDGVRYNVMGTKIQ